MYTETKPAARTSEFWLTIAANVVLFAQQLIGELFGNAPLPPWITMTLSFASVTIYALSRGLAKQGAPYNPAAELYEPSDYEVDEAGVGDPGPQPPGTPASPREGGGASPPR